MKKTEEFLLENADSKYAEFQRKLIPNISPEKVIGVRTPILRKYAKTIYGDKNFCSEFLAELPHKYFEENQLHAFTISLIKDADECAAAVENFLPYVDNWATCDQMSPKALAKHTDKLLSLIDKWIKSGDTYSIRFSVCELMRFFLDKNFKSEYIYKVAAINSEEYYVNMMSAWYMATALAKQWDAAVRVLEEKRLPCWVHNTAIQKARESYRITKEQKEYLKTLKI